jgi:hypothetical protein
MNMHALPYIPKTRDLPMPLTEVDQSSYDWHKHPHTKILLNARIRALKADRKGMLWMLIEHAALEVPFGSVPNDPDRLAEMAGVSAKVWDKAAEQVMGAGFVLCNDDRWYCPTLVDQLSPVAADAGDAPTEPTSKAAERARRYRENKKRDAELAAQSSERDASVTHHASERDANVTQRDDSVTIGGIKGGDLDSDLDQDLESNQNHTPTDASAGRANVFKSELNDVFDYWKNTFGKNAATKLDSKRKSRIVARLKDGYTVEQIKQAIDGCASSDYHIENHHTDIELICRDVTKIDKFIEIGSAPKKPAPVNYSNDVNQRWDQSQQLVPASPDAQAEHLRTTREMGLL